MAKNDDGSRMLRCSFCGKTQDKVDKLIAGTGVCICNECVQLCNSVLEEEGLSSRRRAAREEAADITIPKPTQIKEVQMCIRDSGMVDQRYILGKAVFRLFPFQKIGLIE